MNEFEVYEDISRGSAHTTYIMKDEDENSFILELPDHRKLNDTRYMANFELVAELTSKLHHPNIGKVHGCARLKTKEIVQELPCLLLMRKEIVREIPCLLLDYIHEDRRGEIMPGDPPLEPERALKVIKGITNALNAIQKEGIIMKYLHLGNIKLEGNEGAILTNLFEALLYSRA